MEKLITGLVLFIGMHSASIVALPLRDRLAAKSELGWKASYAIISLVGIILVAKGYAELRQAPTVLFASPDWMRHVAAVLLLPIFALFLAPYFPSRIKRATKHPQLLMVILWSVAHLLVNGTLADFLLFGSVLVWAIADWISLKNRPTRQLPGAPVSAVNDVVLILVGLALYAVMVLWLHEVAFGVKPLV
jgi:uncharacterized membrane protein